MKMNTANNKKIIFWGTPDVALHTLRSLVDSGYNPIVVVTGCDRRQGRGMEVHQSPVSEFAHNKNIKIFKPEKIDADFIKEISDLAPDLNIVVAYGKILPQEIIDIPTHKTINIHYSILPKYRGASPLEQALLNGDISTGVTIQQMALRMDSGDIISEKSVDISTTDTKSTLKEKLINAGSELLISTLPNIFEQKITYKKQKEEEATFCKKIKKEDGLIDINDNPFKNYNKYRAYENWPSVFFIQDDKRYKITKARYEDNNFVIEKVIPEGKKEIEYKMIHK
jgi:methionyl-tRNA formyltransferase